MTARQWGRVALAALLMVLSAGCRPTALQRVPITVSSAGSPEQQVLGKLTVLALRDAGYRVIDKTSLGSSQVVRTALAAGAIDICWEYTGDTWTTYLAHDRPINDPIQLYEKVRSEDAYNQISWVALSPCRRTLAIMMRDDVADKLKINTLDELATHLSRINPDLGLCVPPELYDKASGIRGLETLYHMRFAEGQVHMMPMPAGYEALARGECDCALGSSTDAEIRATGLRLLRDERGFFQASSLAVAVRTPLMQEFPNLPNTLAQLASMLTCDAVAELHRQVLIAGDKPDTVARRFWAKKRPSRAAPSPTSSQ